MLKKIFIVIGIPTGLLLVAAIQPFFSVRNYESWCTRSRYSDDQIYTAIHTITTRNFIFKNHSAVFIPDSLYDEVCNNLKTKIYSPFSNNEY